MTSVENLDCFEGVLIIGIFLFFEFLVSHSLSDDTRLNDVELRTLTGVLTEFTASKISTALHNTPKSDKFDNSPLVFKGSQIYVYL